MTRSAQSVSADAPLPWYLGPAFQMLLGLASLYVLSSFVGVEGVAAFVVGVFVALAILIGLLRIDGSRSMRLWGSVVLVVYLAPWGLQVLSDGRWATSLDASFGIPFFLFVLGAMMRVVFRREPATMEKVLAAACVYLLLGIAFGAAFQLIWELDPAAFTLDQDETELALMHYSFTTLTTVGYGSISPLSPLARALSDLEAFIAQLYVAIVIARLVTLIDQADPASNA